MAQDRYDIAKDWIDRYFFTLREHMRVCSKTVHYQLRFVLRASASINRWRSHMTACAH